MNVKYLMITVSFMLVSVLLSAQTSWEFDKAHSKIQFTAQHMKISEVAGQFTEYGGTIESDGEEFTDAQIKVTIQASSIDTDNKKRDKHLRAEDFFYVEEYPEITFKSESLSKVSDNKYKLVGTLTIRDVSRKETFDVEHTGTVEAMGATRAGFKVTGSIDRFDYNVDWDRSFGQGLVVGREIGINANVQLIKQ
jgi:polyisoprenoid-binding protein YceI